MTPLFPPSVIPLVPIQGTSHGYAVARIFCVGRNYAAHAAEMGATPDYQAPFYFTKTPAHLQLSGTDLAYPPGTADLHHEMELAVYLGLDGPYGYGCALDMTRRDLQAAAKAKARPWDTSKDWEGAVICGAIAPGPLSDTAQLSLMVNGETRQDAPLTDMIHDVPAILTDLARYYSVGAGDVILTGTPAGVGPAQPGDHLVGEITGLPRVETRIK